MRNDNDLPSHLPFCGAAVLSAESAVLFDLDGTLVDTAPDFIAVLTRLCRRENVSPPSPAAVHATVSSGARALVSLAFALEPGNGRFQALLTALLDDYERQLLNTRAQLYPQMELLITLLEQHSVPWGVVTNKPERFSRPLLGALGLLQRCPVLVCPDHVGQTKPHPEPLLLACHLTGTKPGRSFYIGDHPRDIEAGKAAGMTTIAAAFGYLPESPDISEWRADLIANSTGDIINYFWPAQHHGQPQ